MKTTRIRIEDLDYRETEILDNKIIAPSACLMTCGGADSFVPGQLVALRLPDWDESRMYSIASGIKDEHTDIIYDVLPHGKYTPSLAKLRNGDKILISEPFGSFYGQAGPAFLISTGTGIAPYRSMLRSGLRKDKIVIHGSRIAEGFYFQEEFRNLPKGKYIRCCTKEVSDDFFHGRVTNYLKSIENLPEDHLYYLCGNAEMIVEVREILISKSISYNRILSEIYF